MKKINVLLLVVFVITIIGMFSFFEHNSKKHCEVKYPCFLSTKYSTTNIRSGPGEDFPVIGIFQSKHIPIKVIASYKEWYQIEDYSGKVGWIYKNIVSKKHTAISKNKTNIYLKMDEGSKKIAIIDKNIVVTVHKIKGRYVQISLTEDKIRVHGWALKKDFWGLS